MNADTKHTFLWKGYVAGDKVTTFLTRNGKLLIRAGGRLSTYSFFKSEKWMYLVGGIDNALMVMGRAAYVRGGRQALINGGWLIKRLYLTNVFRTSWKYVALMSTYIPHIMQDAVNCPIIARAKIRAFAFGGNREELQLIARQHAWLGGVKVPFVPCRRPDGLAFKPQSRRDMYYVHAILSTHGVDEAEKWLLSNQHRRDEIPHIDKHFGWKVTDGFRIKREMEEAGMRVPPIKNLDVVAWANALHEVWVAKQEEIQTARDVYQNALPLPGENLIPALEQYRVKTQGELRAVGRELHHCAGSYAGYDNYAHYRVDNVLCQVEWGKNWRDNNAYGIWVNQCFDFANSVTEQSEHFRELVEKHLRKVDPSGEEFQQMALKHYLTVHPDNAPEEFRRQYEVVGDEFPF